MQKPDIKTTFKRLRNRYRLIVMNDDTLHEVATFRLTRVSVYVAACTIFVVLVGLTVALLVYTPLKLYIPGYGESRQSRGELQTLKMKTDSLEQAVKYKDQYLNALKKVLQGNSSITPDTASLKIPKADVSDD